MKSEEESPVGVTDEENPTQEQLTNAAKDMNSSLKFVPTNSHTLGGSPLTGVIRQEGFDRREIAEAIVSSLQPSGEIEDYFKKVGAVEFVLAKFNVVIKRPKSS